MTATYRYSRARYRRRFYGRSTSGKELAVVGAIALAMAGATGAAHAAGHAAATVAPVTAPAGATTSGANERLGMTMAAAAGWTGGQASCLDLLWTRESGWQMVWNTAGSGAYGIPQSLPASKMAAAGADYMTDPATEIRWGLGYIATTYVTPCGAWAHETQDGWY
jgi:hypothetical protein